MKLPLAVLLVTAGVASVVGVGVYSAASATASSLAGTFARSESGQHALRAEAQAAMSRASARRARAIEQCGRFRGFKRDLCDAAARADERRSLRHEARPVGSAP